jgi:hypothetical protein
LPFGSNTPDESFGANEMVTRDYLTFYYAMPFNVLGIVSGSVDVIFLVHVSAIHVIIHYNSSNKLFIDIIEISLYKPCDVLRTV